MRPPNISKKEYLQKQEIFHRNLFGFLLGVIQEKNQRIVDPNRDVTLLARIINKNRSVVTMWRNKVSLPQNDVAFMDIVYRILSYLNIANFPIEGYHLYTIDLEKEFGEQIRNALHLNDEVRKIVREPSPVYMNATLAALLEDPIERSLINPSKEEINILARIRFPQEIKPTKDLFKLVLSYYRRQQ